MYKSVYNDLFTFYMYKARETEGDRERQSGRASKKDTNKSMEKNPSATKRNGNEQEEKSIKRKKNFCFLFLCCQKKIHIILHSHIHFLQIAFSAIEFRNEGNILDYFLLLFSVFDVKVLCVFLRLAEKAFFIFFYKRQLLTKHTKI